MTLRRHASAILILAAVAALPASAQNIRPGLWEMNNKMQSDNPQIAQAMAAMQKQMANMPPEQRKAMEEAMAKHGGMKLESAGDGGMVVKMCLTKEVIQDALFGTPQGGNCTHTKTPMVGNTMSYSFSCGNPASSGEGKVTFNGDTAYTSRMTMTSTSNGKKDGMTVDSKARWLGADCGNVKPINPKAAAAAMEAGKK